MTTVVRALMYMGWQDGIIDLHHVRNALHTSKTSQSSNLAQTGRFNVEEKQSDSNQNMEWQVDHATVMDASLRARLRADDHKQPIRSGHRQTPCMSQVKTESGAAHCLHAVVSNHNHGNRDKHQERGTGNLVRYDSPSPGEGFYTAYSKYSRSRTPWRKAKPTPGHAAYPADVDHVRITFVFVSRFTKAYHVRLLARTSYPRSIARVL